MRVGSEHRRPPEGPTRTAVPRSPSTPCCRIAGPAPWSAGRDRWTGCARHVSTLPRCSAGSSTPPPGTGRCGRWIRTRRRLAVRRRDDADRDDVDDGDGHRHRHRRPRHGRRRRPARTRCDRGPAARPRVECTGGEVEMSVEFAPRPEYGLVEPLMTVLEGGVIARGGADVVVLSCPAPLEVTSATASGRLRLAAGDRVLLGLQHRTTSEPWPAPLPAAELDDALRTTADGWRAWSRLHQNYQGPWRDLVHHSGRVLQALSYQPTGAVVAAATTSLPEQVGGERNWDYRGRGAAHRLPRAGLPLPHRERAERRRPGGRGGHVLALHVLAGPGTGRGRAGRRGPHGVRAGRPVCQRCGPAR